MHSVRVVIEELRRLRRTTRRLLLTRASCVLAAAGLAGVLALGGLDYLLRLPAPVRLILLAGLIAGLVVLVRRHLVPATRYAPSLVDVALRVERERPELAGRLASGVEFVERGDVERSPLARLAVDRLLPLAEGGFGRRVDARAARRAAGGLAAVGLVVAAVAVASPGLAATGTLRVLAPWSAAAWPARTAVASRMDEVLPAPGVHPRGEVLTLRAENLTPDGAGERVQAHVRERTAGDAGRWRTITLAHQGDGVHERLVEPDGEAVEVWFETADARTAVERIDLVRPPAVARGTLRVEPPAYAAGLVIPILADVGPGIDERGRPDEPALAGARAELELAFNKPIEPIEPAGAGGDEPGSDDGAAPAIATGDRVVFAGPDADPRSAWLARTFGLDAAMAEAGAEVERTSDVGWILRWTVSEPVVLAPEPRDAFGLGPREPIRYAIDAVVDERARPAVLEPMRDERTLADATVPVRVEAMDDVGLRSLAIAVDVERSGSAAVPAELPEDVAAALLARFEPVPRQELGADLPLGVLGLEPGDAVLLRAEAEDVFEPADGRLVRSEPRRIRIIGEADFGTLVRRDLARVRQEAIRIEATQSALQDGLRRGAASEGDAAASARRQAEIAERIAAQREEVASLTDRIERNRLEDDQLRELLRQSSDLLDFAGRAANRALTSLEDAAEREAAGGDAARGDDADAARGDDAEAARGDDAEAARENDADATREAEDADAGAAAERERGERGADGDGPAPGDRAAGDRAAGEPGDEEGSEPSEDASSEPAPSEGEPSPAGASGGQPGAEQDPSTAGPPGQPSGDATGSPSGPSPAGGEPARADDDGASGADADAETDAERGEDAESLPEPSPEAAEAIDAQQAVREELTDLIRLLDRDEDTWLVRQQLQQIAAEQAALEERTGELADDLIGRDLEELGAEERRQLDAVAEEQRALAESFDRLIEEMRRRAEAMEEADPEAADGLTAAADEGESRETGRSMREAAEEAEQNRLQQAGSQQARAREALDRMQEALEEAQGVRTEELLRELATVREVLERLVATQERELIALSRAETDADLAERARAMIRLERNTSSAAQQARVAGQELRRIARTVDRAREAQGEAIAALRQAPPDAEGARRGEERSLARLQEALDLAVESEEQAEEDLVEQARQQLMMAYRGLLERQVTVRAGTMELAEQRPLGRRGRQAARRLGNDQEAIRTALEAIRTDTEGLADATVFSYVHVMMDRWAEQVRERLYEAEVGRAVSDRQRRIAEAIRRQIEALEDLQGEQPEFAQGEQAPAGGAGGGGGGGGGDQPVLPPTAELLRLRGLQEAIYEETRAVDEDPSLDPAERAAMVDELGRMQRDVLDLGRELLTQLAQPPGGGAAPAPAPAPEPGDEPGPGPGAELPGGQPAPRPDAPPKPEPRP